jgi:ABC-2 type transport system permease protein
MKAFYIAKRDLKIYFYSPLAYVVLGIFLLITGFLFFSTLFINNIASMRAFFNLMPWVLSILAPIITMRLIAEEKKTGTIEQLLTLPITITEIIIGKFLSGLGVIAVGLLFTILFVITLVFLTPINLVFDYGPVIGGYVGSLLLAASFLAIGLFASSLSKNQVIAFIIGFALCFFFYAIDWLAILWPAYSKILEYFSFDLHFQNFSKGIIDSRDVIFYASFIILFLFLTKQILNRE